MRWKQDDLDKAVYHLFKTEEWTMYELIREPSIVSLMMWIMSPDWKKLWRGEEFYQEIGRHIRDWC